MFFFLFCIYSKIFESNFNFISILMILISQKTLLSGKLIYFKTPITKFANHSKLWKSLKNPKSWEFMQYQLHVQYFGNAKYIDFRGVWMSLVEDWMYLKIWPSKKYL